MSKISSLPKKIWSLLPFTGESAPLVSQIDLTGVIATDGRTGKNLNLRRVEKAIDDAFASPDVKAIAISVNSPGGSPVQSRLIHDRLRHLADEKKVPIYTFVEDVGASGGYILALAGDEIYADESSIVGSIGVIGGGFGFPDALEKIGVQRRIYTAGKNKSQLDPFLPEDAEDVQRHQRLLDELHSIFIDLVKRRREDKLEGEADIFTGEYWHAAKARELGLIDDIGELRTTMKKKFGKDVKIKRVQMEERGLLQKILSGQRDGMPVSLLSADEAIDAIEQKTLWSRFGL